MGCASRGAIWTGLGDVAAENPANRRPPAVWPIFVNDRMSPELKMAKTPTALTRTLLTSLKLVSQVNRLVSFATGEQDQTVASKKLHRKPNLRDVAHQARVSAATVSRVLNGSGPVSQAKREAVDSAIEALGFVRSSAARAINSGRTHLVGALIPTLDHAIYARFIETMEAELDAMGLSLIVAGTNGDPERELDKAKRLLEIGVEGLIVSGITRHPDFDALVSRYRVPVISTSYYDPSHRFPTIGYDNTYVARAALDHLVSLGHRKIAVLSGPTHDNDRTKARQMAIAGTPGLQLDLHEADLTFAAASEAVSKIWAAAPDTTALLCLSDVMAQGGLLRLRSMGIGVPDEVSVIGIDDLPASASYDPPLTTVHLPVGVMGQTAARAIANWIEDDARPVARNLTTRLVVRGSTGPCPN